MKTLASSIVAGGLSLIACALPTSTQDDSYVAWYAQNFRHAEDSFQGQQDIFSRMIDEGFDIVLEHGFAYAFRVAAMDDLAALSRRLRAPHPDAPQQEMLRAAEYFEQMHSGYESWLSTLEGKSSEYVSTSLWEGWPTGADWADGVRVLMASEPDGIDMTAYSYLYRWYDRWLED